MFRKPSAHFLIRPCPLKGMSVAFVVLLPCVGDVGDELESPGQECQYLRLSTLGDP
jgi:hypothetical protein